MNIIVCIKIVPDSETIVKIASDGRSIDETNVKFAISPYDEYALEAGVVLKEQFGGEVTVVSIGEATVGSVIRKSLSLGADKAIHLVAQKSRMADSLSIAKAMADEIRYHPFDIIFCGKQSIDAGSGLVGVMLGQLLNVPFISAVSELSVNSPRRINGNRVTAQRYSDGTKEVVECSMPCVITAEKGLSKPRFPSLKDIMLAKKKPLDAKPVPLEIQQIDILRMEYPPIRHSGRIIGEGIGSVPELVRLLKEEAKVL